MTSGASVVFWDVDGTLLTTGRAGVRAWELAVQDVAGTVPDLSTFTTAGLTDLEIGRRLVERGGVTATQEAIIRVVRAYEAYLPSCLPLRHGHVLPMVRENLDALRDCPGVITLLLTGNTRAGAAAKLGHYGLAAYFADGGYAEGEEDRVAIARCGLAVAQRLAGDGGVGRIFVIGDTPYDIHCGKAIGAHTLAVATGVYSVAELAAHEPWRVLDCLPDPDEFLLLIGLSREVDEG